MDKIVSRFLILFALAMAISLVHCTYTIRVKDGMTAYELKQYAKAVPMLKDAFRKEKDVREKAKIAAAIAQSFEKSNQHEDAVAWWKQAKENHSQDAYWQGYIESLIFNNRLQEAQEVLPEAIDVIGPVWVRKKGNALATTKLWLKEPEKSGFTVATMEGINSPQADFAPYIMGEKLLFSSDRKDAQGVAVYEWTNERYMDLFSFDTADKSVQAYDEFFNTEQHEGYFNKTEDGQTVYFVRCGPNEESDEHTCQIYSTYREGENWAAPERLAFQDLRTNYTMPAPGNASGSLLFFASDDKDGWGGLDLYFVQKNKEWEDPRILPRTINSEGDEAFPFVEGDTLYFSSNGLGGMGGYDIYKSYLSDNKWQPAHNLKAPLNSVADDMSFVIDFENSTYQPYLQRGYFVSNRKGGKGKDDIYSFERVPAIPDTPEVVEIPTPTPTPKPDTLASIPDTSIVLNGVRLKISVRNKSTLAPIPEAALSLSQGAKDSSLTANAVGEEVVPIKIGYPVFVTASKAGFLQNKRTFVTDTIDVRTGFTQLSMEILLEPIELNKEIVLENIYYDFDKWDIRQDAEASLNELVEILNQNLGMIIRLNSYTDCRGSDRYNQILSQKRADAAIAYLMGKGINPDRLKARGFGELSPISDCRCTECTEDEHQLNRRTSFTILEL